MTCLATVGRLARQVVSQRAMVFCTVLAALVWSDSQVIRAGTVIEPAYRETVRHFGSRDGLPQNSVTTMLQDHQGFLWLGTYGGLVRFDGESFRIYRYRPDSGPGSDRITTLAEDDLGRLWVGTENAGLSLMVGGEFHRSDVCAGRCRVRDLAADGSYMLVATDQGLYRLAFDQGFESHKLADGIWRHVVVVPEEAVFFSGVDGLYSWHDGRLQNMPLPEESASSDQVHYLAWIDGTLWAATYHTLYYRKGDQWRPAAGRPIPEVSVMATDGLGRLWLANRRGELLRRDRPGQSFEAVDVPEAGQVLSLLLDRERNFWIGSDGRGLLRLRPSSIALIDDPAQGFDLPAVAVAGDGRGGQWLGLNCDGLRHRSRAGEVRAWPGMGAIDSPCPWSFHVELRADGSGTKRLWIGTMDGRLGFYEPGEQRFHKVARWGHGSMLRAIHVDSEGQVLVATEWGLTRLTLDQDGSVTAREQVEAADGREINQISPARDGGLWLVGQPGLARLVDDRLAEQWTAGDGLQTPFTRGLYEAADGTLWLGSYGGGLHVIGDGRVEHYDESSGLFDDVVSCIIEDGQGRLWTSGNRGIAVLDETSRARARSGETIFSLGYAEDEGLTPAETNGGMHPACHRDELGRLWFPLVSGYAVVDPERALRAVEITPEPVIDAVTVAGMPIEPGQVVTLDHHEGNLAIQFSAPALAAAQKMGFRVRLSDTAEWTEVGAQRTVFYPVVPWGEHGFEVQARYRGGPWSVSTARLTIVRPRPWYLQPFWWLLIVLAGGLLGLAGHRAMVTYLRAHERQVTRPIRERAERLASEVRRDELTGLVNRRGFVEELSRAMRRKGEDGLKLGVLMIDIDHFKSYNDRFGHLAGDDCLRKVAAAMAGAMREGDLLARVGGEEFVALVYSDSPRAAKRLAQRLRDQVHRLALTAPDGGIVTVSIGWVMVDSAVVNEADELLGRADEALYRAKRDGRDCIRFIEWDDPDRGTTHHGDR